MFAAPSSYCSSGINAKHIGVVTSQLLQWDVDSAPRLELMVRNLKVFEERIKRRIAAYRWLLSAAWAVYFAPLIARIIGVNQTALPLDGPTVVAAFGLLLFSFLAFDAYGRGVDIFFRGLELGCNEYLARLQATKERTS
jgi:hypothetical protein